MMNLVIMQPGKGLPAYGISMCASWTREPTVNVIVKLRDKAVPIAHFNLPGSRANLLSFSTTFDGCSTTHSLASIVLYTQV